MAAVCVGLATATAVDALRPTPPSGVEVLVAARDLPAGLEISASDLRVVTVPQSAAVGAAVASDDARAALVGHTTAVPVPAGMPLVPQLVAGADLTGPPGTVVAAVRLADDAMAALLAPGDRVDLLAAPAEGGAGVTLARGALVLPSPPREGGGGLFGSSGADPAPLLVAVRPDEAAALAGAGVSEALFAVVVS
jgi:Flp pilus assembly protein CpaB